MSDFHGDGHDDLGNVNDPFAPDEENYFSDASEDEPIPPLNPDEQEEKGWMNK